MFAILTIFIDGLKKTAEITGQTEGIASGDRGPLEIAGLVINLILGFLGVAFMGLMLYAGINWLMARGEEKKVTDAKHTIQHAIVGLGIIFGAYFITQFVLDYIFSLQTTR